MFIASLANSSLEILSVTNTLAYFAAPSRSFMTFHFDNDEHKQARVLVPVTPYKHSSLFCFCVKDKGKSFLTVAIVSLLLSFGINRLAKKS